MPAAATMCRSTTCGATSAVSVHIPPSVKAMAASPPPTVIPPPSAAADIATAVTHHADASREGRQHGNGQTELDSVEERLGLARADEPFVDRMSCVQARWLGLVGAPPRLAARAGPPACIRRRSKTCGRHWEHGFEFHG